jgi:hypothetical protein
MEAEPLYVRALAITERTLGLEHPTMQAIRANYTDLLEVMKQSEETT